MPGRPYCYAHRVGVGDRSVTLRELLRLADEFDASSSERFTAAEFVAWVKPEIDGLEG